MRVEVGFGGQDFVLALYTDADHGGGQEEPRGASRATAPSLLAERTVTAV